MTGKKILLVGQAPSRNGGYGEKALDAGIPSSASGRLLKLFDMSREEYLDRFKRLNLLDYWPGALKSGRGDKFPILEGRKSAQRIQKQISEYHILCIGKRVGKCFNMDDCFKWEEYIHCYPFTRNRVAMIPHTSGLNRFYNDPDNIQRTKTFLQELISDA